MIPQETVDLILNTARVEDIVGDYVTLKRRGSSFVACCPFHNEKTPSFYVTPSKGIYKCFGCGKAGSAVGFLMEYEHCTYVEALRTLARRYGIEVVEKEDNPEDIIARQRRESLYAVMDFAQNFFVQSLRSPEGMSHGYAYYKSRGLEDETIARFGLGWAPSSRTALLDAATAAGYKVEYLLAAGLCVQYDDGRVVDKFHARVTFPVHSVSGRVIAFSCRTLSSEGNIAKYVNSPETELYHKSNALFGIYLAKSEISREDKCYLLEGNVDVVSMSQLGITNVVASCGTALTREQIQLMHRFTENVTIMYDGDKAGIKAALKGINLILSEGMNVRVVLLPDGDDPDSFSRKHTLEEVKEFVGMHEQDFINFKTDLLLGEAAGDPLRKANLINDIADTIAEISDAIKRAMYVESVSRKFKIESDIVFARINDTRQKMLEEKKKYPPRPRPEDSQPAPVMEVPSAPVAVTIPTDEYLISQLEVNKIVAPVEKDLLSFLLTYGTEILQFESDSEYFTPDESERPTVADFIISALDSDGGQMLNPVYQNVYEGYVDAYCQGMPQDRIVRSLLDSQDRNVAYVAGQLSMEKHQLTVKQFEDSMTTTSSWLVTIVPHAIIIYMARKIESRLDEIKRGLVEADSDTQLSMMGEMLKLQKTLKAINEKMKR